jgi:glycosyltransferase involved in cell wall biosynthesis
MKQLSVLLVANVLTHYRLPLYQELQRYVDLQLVFFSDGREWYWKQIEQPSADTLDDARWLAGWWIGRTRIVLGLLPVLLNTSADVVIKDSSGKFAIPVTYLLARLRRKPFILWASMWEHPSRGVHRFTRPLMRHLYRRSDALISYGRHVSQYVIAEGARPERVVIAPQAVRSHVAKSHTDRWQPPLKLLFVGRLEPWKGPEVLLRALASLDRSSAWRLRVAGRGSQEQFLVNIAGRLGILDRVDFLGYVANESLRDLYDSSAVVVIPSVRTTEFTEPWSLVVNEAMHAGTLVLASDSVGAVQDGLVLDGQSGVVFHADDVNDLAQRLAVILNPVSLSHCRAMAESGSHAIQRYSFHSAACSFVEAAKIAIGATTAESRT